MRQKNTGIKFILVVLVIVCVIQAFHLSSLTSQMEDLNNQLSEVNRKLQDHQYQINDLWEEEKSLFDASYQVISVHWDAGTVQVEFEVEPIIVSEHTRVLVNNQIATTELERQGNSFVGLVEYPINQEDYATEIYLYEGDYEETWETIDWIGAATWASAHAFCGFDGFSAYGNGKITVAGTVKYLLDTEEKVTSARWVVGENVTELDANKEGSISINASEFVGESSTDEDLEIESVYVELLTESGVTYRLYPEIFAGANYQIDEVEQYSEYVYQPNMLGVILADGTEYKMNICME
ncbi:MAG: hypothetical protein E7269_01520 [Lachnospiraceae bacterium]|nr:hypothetical protein [Lachnospiraceae bacterium]